MKPPAISIITVCRNERQRLPACRENILNVLGDADEWVVQDGGSEDGTAHLFEDESDDRVQFYSEPDQGIYEAMNRAVRRASGDFILFMGVDDKICIALDEVRARLQGRNTIYYGDVWRISSKDRYAGPFDARKLARTNICQQAIFYPASVFETRRFDVRYPLQADWVFNMACFSDPAIRFEYMPVVVAEYGQSGMSSTAMDMQFQREYRMLLRRHFSLAQRWHPELLSLIADGYRRLPGVPPPRQRPARV